MKLVPSTSIALAMLLVLARPAIALDKVEIFLSVSGIVGDSTDPKHAHEIQAQSLTLGATRSGGTIPTFTECVLVKPVDSATPKLFKACVTGEVLPSITVSIRQDGVEDAQRFTLGSVLITSISQKYESDAIEQLSLAYGKLTFFTHATGAGAAPDKLELEAGPLATSPDASAGKSSAGAPASPSAKPAVLGKPKSYSQVANPALKGQLGRLVAAFPPEAPAKSTPVAVVKPGETSSIADGYGSQAVELLPGTYDILISNKRVTGLPVSSAMDTQVAVGVLRVSADKGTHVTILDSDGKTGLTDGYGNMEVGLPVGTFYVQIAGQSAAVTIEGGKVTEF